MNKARDFSFSYIHRVQGKSYSPTLLSIVEIKQQDQIATWG